MTVIQSFILKLKTHYQDKLYKNSYFYLLTTVITSISSFVFWIIATRVYPSDEVGVATALISSITLVSGFSTLGLNWAIIRFLPNEENKTNMINSCLVITVLASFILSLFFILGIRFFSPALMYINENLIILVSLIVFTIFLSLTEFQKRIFLSFRRADYAFFQSIINSLLKIIIVFFVLSFGAIGIFFAWGVSSIVAVIFSMLFLLPLLIKGYFFSLGINKKIIEKLIHFSFGNYIAENLWALPRNVLPLIIISLLSAQSTAYFYISWSIANTIYLIPFVISSSLLVEGSFSDENIPKLTKKSIKFNFVLLLPLIFLSLLFGKFILSFFGEEYAFNAFFLFSILVLASIPLSFVELYVAILRIKKDVFSIIFYYGIIALVTIVGSYLLLPMLGIIGIGVSWFFAQSICAVIQLVQLFRHSDLV